MSNKFQRSLRVVAEREINSMNAKLTQARTEITREIERRKAASTISRYWRFRFKRDTIWMLVKAVADTGFTLEKSAKMRCCEY